MGAGMRITTNHDEYLEPARYTDPALLILVSLLHEDRHGYAIIKDVERFCGTRLASGTLHPALKRLMAQGFIQRLPKQGRTRPYRLTRDGGIVVRCQLVTMVRIIGECRREDAPLPPETPP